MLEGVAAEGRAVAGTEVRVALDMRDRFGNVSASRSEQHVAVEATGACTAPFEEFPTDSFRCELLIYERSPAGASRLCSHGQAGCL